MIVIADTTPVNYLVLIGEIDLLSALYGRVILPATVREELLRLRAPEPVRAWAKEPPAWLEIRSPSALPDASLDRLNPGERDAIGLAEELAADLVILDDLQGRREAERRRLPVIGTLGVLEEAADRGLLDLQSAIERLVKTSFHVSPEILKGLLGS